MWVMVLQQQTEALREERPETGADVSKRLNSVKHLLWHGNTEEALERVSDLIMDLSLIQAHSGAAKKLGDALSEFQIYIGNNQEYIPNYSEAESELVGDSRIRPAQSRLQAVNLDKERIGNSETEAFKTPISRE
jgi:hypothetical protein